jgi:hypothetical protein
MGHSDTNIVELMKFCPEMRGKKLVSIISNLLPNLPACCRAANNCKRVRQRGAVDKKDRESEKERKRVVRHAALYWEKQKMYPFWFST